MRRRLAVIKKKVMSFLYPPTENRYPRLLKRWFYDMTGERIDFCNIKNFNQFIQWLKVFDNKPYKSRMTDKFLMRDYVSKELGEQYLTKLYGVYESFDEVDFTELPKEFVIKCNHGCGMNVIVKDKRSVKKEELRSQFKDWMKTNFAFVHYPGVEPQYADIKRKIICEEYLGDNLIDIQFWCTKGNVLFISYIDQPHGKNKKATFDEKWNRLDFVTSLPEHEGRVAKPKKLAEMVRIAKYVSSSMEFLRLDFYILEDGSVKISEFTFTPANGLVNWVPKKTNEEIYKKILAIRSK